MYPSSSLLSDNHTETISIDELIENADGFAGVFPGTLYNICNISPAVSDTSVYPGWVFLVSVSSYPATIPPKLNQKFGLVCFGVLVKFQN